MWKVIDKIFILIPNIFNAVKFAAYDYDSKLQITKTPKQRLTIWLTIIIVTIIVAYILLLLLGILIKPLINHEFTPAFSK